MGENCLSAEGALTHLYVSFAPTAYYLFDPYRYEQIVSAFFARQEEEARAAAMTGIPEVFTQATDRALAEMSVVLAAVMPALPFGESGVSGAAPGRT